MGRPYTEAEREEIRIKLKKTAAEMFTKQGFKEFRVQQLTKEVGISLGGFYTFYKDKEALYEEILRDEKNRIRQKIVTLTAEENQTPQVFMKTLADVFLSKASTNKFYTGEYSGLLESMVWNDDPVAAADNLHFVRQIRAVWEKRGLVLSLSDEEIAAAVALLAAVCANKDRIGSGFELWFQLLGKMFSEQF